jgi:glutamate N-acetyltransferase / amino-acid N-acetyltransferase
MDIKMIEGGVCAPHGFMASGVSCGIKESNSLDLCVLASEKACAAAGTFTPNAFKAAPVVLTLEHLEKSGRLQAVVANSGNANACTGERGLADAAAMARLTAGHLGIEASLVGVASTGIIGEYLPMKKMEKGIAAAVKALSPQAGTLAARAIMTTDTHPKEAAFDFGGFCIGGMAKGSGMIKPNMATLLGFITTDARIELPDLSKALKASVEASFNLINIDGCTSTNDSVIILANGASEVEVDPTDFGAALFQVCSSLARILVEDAEGATHLVRVNIAGANDAAEAKKLATAVAESPLVKTAFFGGDPNWGRIVQALGAVEPGLDPSGVSIKIGGLAVCLCGEPISFDVESLEQAMAAKEIAVEIELSRGEAGIEVLTCDLSYDYVKINAEYHT